MNFIELPLKYENGHYKVLSEQDDYKKGGFFINSDNIETIDVNYEKETIDIFMKSRSIMINGNFEELSSIAFLLNLEKYVKWSFKE